MAAVKLKIPTAKETVHGWPSEQSPGDFELPLVNETIYTLLSISLTFPSAMPYMVSLYSTERFYICSQLSSSFVDSYPSYMWAEMVGYCTTGYQYSFMLS